MNNYNYSQIAEMGFDEANARRENLFLDPIEKDIFCEKRQFDPEKDITISIEVE